VVDVFQNLGYPVSLYDWTGLNNQRIEGGSINDSGYPTGEYIHGNMSDAYILLDDPDAPAIGELSYPKFRTQNGSYVSMRYGIMEWDRIRSGPPDFSSILPVLKRHGMTGATIAWKNLIGFITADGYSNNRFGGYGEMHNYFFGSSSGPGKDYGLVGRQMAFIKTPDLNIVDAIWVPYEGNFSGNAVRQDILLASTDPMAVDWYASEYLLFPITGVEATSAARGGIFRNTTRINQKTAKLLWPGGSGSYPFLDMVGDYDGSTPVDEEKNQLNVYVNQPREYFILFLPFSIRNIYPE
jgi:hypothetical protein